MVSEVGFMFERVPSLLFLLSVLSKWPFSSFSNLVLFSANCRSWPYVCWELFYLPGMWQRNLAECLKSWLDSSLCLEECWCHVMEASQSNFHQVCKKTPLRFMLDWKFRVFVTFLEFDGFVTCVLVPLLYLNSRVWLVLLVPFYDVMMFG